jgi:hypothetical protein
MSDANAIRPRFRDDRLYDFRDYMVDLLKGYETELVKTCITCASFRESDEQCTKFKARPPARVIAYGCKDYFNEEEIPF